MTKKHQRKMMKKNLLVSFVMALFLMTGLAAAADVATINQVTYDSITIYGTQPSVVSVVAGEDSTFKVYFTATENDTDVTVEATLEGEKVKAYASTGYFDVEANKTYRKVLTLKVPYELKDEISNDLLLSIEIDGKKYKTEVNDIELRVQRPSYNAVVKSVVVPSSISAGETFPVELVLKNLGYNDLDDVYVSAAISELGVSQGPKWFGDIASLERCDACDNDDEEDTVFGKMNLVVPYSAKAGVYTLEVVVLNDDTETKVVKQIVIENALDSNVIATAATKTVAQGEEAVFDLLIVNPTNNVKVYTIVTESEGLTSTVSQGVIAVPAGSSKDVKVAASSDVEGEQSFTVSVISGQVVEKTVSYSLNVEGKKVNTVFVLTVVLAVIFLILLITLIVLLGKKPEKAEDFGESYY
jgi:hypothetical protein